MRYREGVAGIQLLGAVASGTGSLMAADTLHRFGLASSAAASKAAANLVAEGVLVQEGHRFLAWFRPGALPSNRLDGAPRWV